MGAHVEVKDRATSPVDTLRVHARGEGAWANGFSVVIADGSHADTFRLTVQDAGANTVEEFDNLVVSDASLARVNGSSAYVRLENLDSASAPPENLPDNGSYGLGDTQAGVDDNAPLTADIVGSATPG